MTKLTKISIIIFVISFLMQITVSNHLAIKTQELNDTQKQIFEVQNQISVINQDIYLSSSITGMESKALLNGFSPMSDPVKSLNAPTIARAY